MDITFILFGLAILFCLVVLSAAAYLYYLDKKYEHIPGPPNDSFWFGCLVSFQEYSENPAEYFFKLFQKYGKTFKLRALHRIIVSSIDPDVVKELGVSGRHPKTNTLSMLFGKLFGTRFLSDKSILTETNIEKALWKRAQFNSMFNRGYFKNMSMEFNTVIEPLMKRLAGLADGKTIVTMLDEFNHVALDVIAQIAFGLELNALDSSTNPFTTAINTTFQGLAYQSRNPFYWLDPRIWKFVLRARKEAHFLRNFGKKMISERMAAKTRGDYVPEDILSLIVQMKENYPDFDTEELIDDFVTFFVAGQETTASHLSYTIVNLGKNPEVMKKLQEEVDDIVGEKPMIDYNDLQKLTYLDMVLKESLRLHPIVFGATRESAHDVTINGITIPKGTDVLLSTHGSARDEENFEDAFSFKPERFSPKAEKRVNPYVYFPFSLGSRTCLGKYFADMEAKIVMTKLIQRFEFVLDPNQSFEELDFITSRPKGKAAVTLTLREHMS